MYRKYSNKEKKQKREASPVKNRVYCPRALCEKLVFESIDKALRYIAYNASEISENKGHAPVRAYYCEACGGWHTTSKKYLTKNRD